MFKLQLITLILFSFSVNAAIIKDASSKHIVRLQPHGEDGIIHFKCEKTNPSACIIIGDGVYSKQSLLSRLHSEAKSTVLLEDYPTIITDNFSADAITALWTYCFRENLVTHKEGPVREQLVQSIEKLRLDESLKENEIEEIESALAVPEYQVTDIDEVIELIESKLRDVQQLIEANDLDQSAQSEESE